MVISDLSLGSSLQAGRQGQWHCLGPICSNTERNNIYNTQQLSKSFQPTVAMHFSAIVRMCCLFFCRLLCNMTKISRSFHGKVSQRFSFLRDKSDGIHLFGVGGLKLCWNGFWFRALYLGNGESNIQNSMSFDHKLAKRVQRSVYVSSTN